MRHVSLVWTSDFSPLILIFLILSRFYLTGGGGSFLFASSRDQKIQGDQPQQQEEQEEHSETLHNPIANHTHKHPHTPALVYLAALVSTSITLELSVRCSSGPGR